jgi:hypothetical protein
MKQLSNKWINHPEQQQGELLLTNCITTFSDKLVANWKTARVGQIAYNCYGEALLNTTVPVFVQRQEVIDNGNDPNKLGLGYQMQKMQIEANKVITRQKKGNPNETTNQR